MTLEIAVMIARKHLAGVATTHLERDAAYTTLAKFHGVLENLERLMRGA